MQEYLPHLTFAAASIFGGVAHYLKKILKKEIDVNASAWYRFKSTPAVLYTLIIFIFTIIGALAGDIVNAHTGILAAIYTGFVTGFAVDAGLNADPQLKQAISPGTTEVK
jgi:hypothetical protein